MRLPDIKRRYGVQSLGREDIYGPLREAAAVSQAIGVTVDVIQEAAGTYLQNKYDQEIDDNNLALSKEMGEWEAKHRDREYYHSDEIHPDIDVPRTEKIVDDQGNETEIVREKIPKYEVYPHMFKKKAEAAIGAKGANFTSDRVGKAWLQKQRATADMQFQKITLKALDSQKVVIRNMSKQNIEEALVAGKYDMARALAERYKGTPDEVGELHRLINYREETDNYDMLLMHETPENLPFIEDMISFLGDDERYNGELNIPERLGYQLKFRHAKSRITSADQADQQLQIKLAKKNADDMIEALDNVLNIDVEEFNRAFFEVQHHDPIRAMKLVESMSFWEEAHKIGTMLPATRDAYLNEMESVPQSPQAANMIKKLRTHSNNLMARANNDTMSYGRDMGLYKLTPAPRRDAEAGSYGKWLIERNNNDDKARNITGTSTGLYSRSELPSVMEEIDSMNIQQKMARFGEISALGSDAYKVYEQLKLTGQANTFALAGQLFADGDKLASRAVLKGAEIRANEPDLLGPVKQELIPLIKEEIGNVYGGNALHRRATTEGVLNAYAFLKNRNSMVSGKFDADVDTDLIDEAIQMVTGGLLEYNDSMIEPPVRSMRQREFEGWLDDLHPSYIQSLGRADRYPASSLLNHIRSGKLKLINVAQGQYALYDHRKHEVVKDRNTQLAFVLKYNKQAPTYESVSRLKAHEEAGTLPTRNSDGTPSLGWMQEFKRKQDTVAAEENSIRQAISW